MKFNLICLFFFLFFINSYGQEKALLVFDLDSKTKDTLVNVAYDTTISNINTPYSLGILDENIELLDELYPENNIYPNTQFTYKRKAALDFDLDHYPIRTSMKLFWVRNDSLIGYCSGSMISKRHVLTAAHCVSSFNGPNADTTSIFIDSMYVCPIYDNGIFNTSFDCSAVSKIYLFNQWKIGREDIAILELDNPIGENTGWLSIGFEQDDHELKDGIFYKFSYPGAYLPFIDSTHYNGDTLYYNYGKVDFINDNIIGVKNVTAIPGESGSSLTKVENDQFYTSYGVLSYANNLSHTKINNWMYYAFENIIKDDLVLSTPMTNTDFELRVFPNPTKGVFQVHNTIKNESIDLSLYDAWGRKLLFKADYNLYDPIDISNYPDGVYYLKSSIGHSIKMTKIIKCSSGH